MRASLYIGRGTRARQCRKSPVHFFNNRLLVLALRYLVSLVCAARRAGGATPEETSSAATVATPCITRSVSEFPSFPRGIGSARRASWPRKTRIKGQRGSLFPCPGPCRARNPRGRALTTRSPPTPARVKELAHQQPLKSLRPRQSRRRRRSPERFWAIKEAGLVVEACLSRLRREEEVEGSHDRRRTCEWSECRSSWGALAALQAVWLESLQTYRREQADLRLRGWRRSRPQLLRCPTTARKVAGLRTSSESAPPEEPKSRQRLQ